MSVHVNEKGNGQRGSGAVAVLQRLAKASTRGCHATIGDETTSRLRINALLTNALEGKGRARLRGQGHEGAAARDFGRGRLLDWLALVGLVGLGVALALALGCDTVQATTFLSPTLWWYIACALRTGCAWPSEAEQASSAGACRFRSPFAPLLLP